MYTTMKIITLFLILSGEAHAWDYVYDMDMLPNDAIHGVEAWSAPTWANTNVAANYVLDGVLITRSEGLLPSNYLRSITSNTPLTIETRVRVLNGTATLSPSIGSLAPIINVYRDKLELYYRDETYSSYIYRSDFTIFRTLRVAMQPTGETHISLDGLGLIQVNNKTRFQGYTEWGISSVPVDGDIGLPEAQWDYFAYSKSYAPVPEPATLVTLACGLAGMAGVVRRKAPGTGKRFVLKVEDIKCAS